MAVAQTVSADVLAEADEAKLAIFHRRILFISGMGFFTDPYELFIIGAVMGSFDGNKSIVISIQY